MSFLVYRGGERPDRRTPERVYAIVDEDASDDRGSIVLEAVEADWFDEDAPNRPWAESPTVSDLDWHVSLLEVAGDAVWRVPDLREGGEWLELELSTESSQDVLHFVNIFAAPDEQRLLSASPVPDDVEERLRTAHNLDPLPDAGEDDLSQLLAAAGWADAAAVYDVGQGACTALIAGGTPLLYFDFGGGALWNTSTYPSQLQQFCFSTAPPVVLSHWDTDHWATAQRDARALLQPWIVPRQSGRLKPNQLSFLINLINACTPPRVHVWPSSLPSLSVGRVTIERGTGASANDSGLALIWDEDRGSGRMLFPADAAYDHLASANQAFTSLVASHHGGRTRSTFVPSPDGATHGRLAYSYGAGNCYGHPLPKDEADHAALWGAGKRTPALRSSLGHVHLYWRNSQPDAAPACGGAYCQLDCCQR
jgi:hypothetical protein